MADAVIENPILNSPFEEPTRHWLRPGGSVRGARARARGPSDRPRSRSAPIPLRRCRRPSRVRARLVARRAALGRMRGNLQPADSWKDVERTVGLRDGDSGHLPQRGHAEIPIRFVPLDHAAKLLLAVGERRLRRDLHECRRVGDEELVQLGELRSEVGTGHQPPDPVGCVNPSVMLLGRTRG
jgi:hypothetical protein